MERPFKAYKTQQKKMADVPADFFEFGGESGLQGGGEKDEASEQNRVVSGRRG